jgi:hypothetical protein
MNHRRLAMVLFLIAAFSISVSLVRADELSEATKITFSEPVTIPGHTLPAGMYWFVLANSNSNRDSANRLRLYATVFTFPSEHREAADGTILTFAERPSGTPEAILTWFYPGVSTGHEFIYPQDEEKELVHDARQNVVAEPSGFAGGH